MKPIGEVYIGRGQYQAIDVPQAGRPYVSVPGIPRATPLRWACEEIGESRSWGPILNREVAAAALLLCEAIGTDEADSEEWG